MPLKFDADIPISKSCKELLTGMMNKDPEKRLQLIDVMNLEYYMMEDEEIEAEIKVEEAKI